MFKLVMNLIHDESGATAVEYGLIAALVSVAGVTALQSMGISLQNIFGTVSTSVDGTVSSP